MHLGFEVLSVSTSEECLLHVSPDYKLVFLDVSTTGADGYDVGLQIHKRFPNMQERPIIVALSEVADRSTRENCMRAGIDGFILKPVPVDKLRSILTQLLESRGDSEH